MIGEKTRKVIEAICKEHLRNVTSVLEIFEDFFGEDKVDLQGVPTISEIEEEFSKTYDNISIKTALGTEESSRLKEKMSNIQLIKDIPDEILSSIPSIRDLLDKIMSKLESEIQFHIVVYFPRVRVSNEYDHFIDITELYVKVPIDMGGTMEGSFSLNRGEYTMTQYSCDYMHSHVCGIPKRNFKEFLPVCLGSGPIRNTVNYLNAYYDLDIWRLFCVELEKYVATESLSGGPYRRLEEVAFNRSAKIVHINLNDLTYITSCLRPMVYDFIKYFIEQKKLIFNYKNGGYSIGMNITKFILLVSNEFITWFNTKGRYIYQKGIIRKEEESLENILTKVFVFKDGIYRTTNTRDVLEINRSNLGVMGTFKGKEVVVHITEEDNINNYVTTILNPEIIGFLLNRILKLVNCKYGRNKSSLRDESEKSRGTNNSDDQEFYYL